MEHGEKQIRKKNIQCGRLRIGREQDRSNNAYENKRGD